LAHLNLPPVFHQNPREIAGKIGDYSVTTVMQLQETDFLYTPYPPSYYVPGDRKVASSGQVTTAFFVRDPFLVPEYLLSVTV